MTEKIISGKSINLSRQRGVTLIVTLILLLLLTILGVTAMSTSTLQERMAGNFGSQEVAFQAAESGVRAGEDWLAIGLTSAPTPVGAACATPSATPCVYTYGVPGNFLALTDNWWLNNSGGTNDTSSEPTAGFQHDPMYVIEQRAYLPDSFNQPGTYAPPSAVVYFRVTAIGWDRNYSGSSSLVQSIFVKRFF